jgi:hypothetical protein
MVILLKSGYDPHSMEHSTSRVFITPRRTGKLAASRGWGDCLEVAGLGHGSARRCPCSVHAKLFEGKAKGRQ